MAGEGKANILIVDDDPNLRKTLSDILRAKGYEAFAAKDGGEGLAMIKDHIFDIVLIDLKLPDMSGLEVLVKVKADHPHMEAIILTGNATLDSAIEATNKGVFSYLQKPYEIDQLMLQVRHAIEKQQAEEKIRQHQEHLEDLVRGRTRELDAVVAEHKLAEEEIRKLNEDLRKRIVELEEARILAEAANKAKSDFLANMSHELTTPLNSVIGFSQILQDGLYGELSEKQKEYVSDILSSGQHLLGLITDMIDLSQVTSGSMELRLSRFLVKDVLKSSITLFNEEAIKHNLKLSLDIEPDADKEIEADSGKLTQIVFNLLSNAVKFTPAGGSVSVHARPAGEDLVPAHGQGGQPQGLPLQDFIEISVSDTGIGIKPEDLPGLFKDIAQLEAPYTKKYSGTGVGLILTKKLIELHGGNIWVESESGKGSTFRFAIPCKGKQPSEQIIDPVTKRLTWEYFLKHISRVLSFHKRKGRHFGLLRIELGNTTKPEEHMSIIEILRGLVRQHEILSKSRDGIYYLITFEADRKVVEDTALRITTALKENGYKPVIKTAVYMENGENIKDMLEALNT